MVKRYGLIGSSLSHSFSKQYFDSKFKKESTEDCSYELFPLKTIDELKNLIHSVPELGGLNVTFPYKEAVIPFLDELCPIAKRIQAVNTVNFIRTQNGVLKLKGTNTDVIGFRESLKPFLGISHDRALIFGTGGASKAAAYVLDQLQISYFKVSRTPKGPREIGYTDLDDRSISTFRFLINCTTLGTFPKVDQTLPINFDGIGKNHLAYDMVYNPLETKFLKIARDKGAITVNGLSMLKMQAEASWNYWQRKD